MSDQGSGKPPHSRASRIIAGILAADFVGWLICTLFVVAWKSAERNDASGFDDILRISVFPNLIFVPMAMGIIAAWFWRMCNLSLWGYLGWSCVSLLTALLGAFVVWKEGMVCLAIVSPLMLVAMFGGCAIGRLWFRKRDGSRLQLTILPLLVLVALAEAFTRRDQTASVSDELLIRAPAARVWPHVLEFPPIAEPPDYWLWKLGLPSPAATTSAGEYVGADRCCIFSNGIVFKEAISALLPREKLTFDIVEQPADPELLGHLTLQRGQFDLRENSDGTTTLTGTSWYTLHVRPLWYFNLWTRDVTRRVHLRVMRHIKALAEQDTAFVGK